MPDSQQFAERLLRHLTDPERAAAIVGDLAETAAARGGSGFWPAVLATAAALAWRPAALIAGCVAVEVLIGATLALSMNTHLSRSTTAWPKLPAMLLGFSSMLLSVVAVFQAVRHGLRDPVARLALALTVIGWAGGALHFVGPLLLASIGALLLMLAWTAASSAGRTALAVVGATLLASWAMFFAIVMLNAVGRRAGMLLVFPINYTLLLAVQLFVSTRVRRLLC
jgi:hypothetical protein